MTRFHPIYMMHSLWLYWRAMSCSNVLWYYTLSTSWIWLWESKEMHLALLEKCYKSWTPDLILKITIRYLINRYWILNLIVIFSAMYVRGCENECVCNITRTQIQLCVDNIGRHTSLVILYMRRNATDGCHPSPLLLLTLKKSNSKEKYIFLCFCFWFSFFIEFDFFNIKWTRGDGWAFLYF